MLNYMGSLTVLKVEDFPSADNGHYYVECTVGSETFKTKSVKKEKKTTAIEWNETTKL